MQTHVLDYLIKGALVHKPEKTAVLDGGCELSFTDLELSAKRMASSILGLHPVFNKPIAVFLPKCLDTIIADVAILFSGNFYSNLDVKSPLERLKSLLDNLQPALIITSAKLLPLLMQLNLPSLTVFTIEEVQPNAVIYPDERFEEIRARLVDTDPLCIINTSGSTGIPKSVVLNHRSTIDFMDWAFDRLALDGNETIGSLSPFYFDIYTLELFLTLAKGATLVIIPEQYAAFPAKLVEFLELRKISFIFWVPTIMVNIANQDLLSKRELPELRKIFFAGEVFPTRHFNYWRRRLLSTVFVNLYGPIEITVDCTYFVVDREFNDDEKLPIGFPCRNTDVLILNEKDEVAGIDEPGELCVRGSSLAMGYWNNPEKTAQAFVQNPRNSHYPEQIYRTGDLVHRNSRGEIMFLGRKDFQIKHLGYRIELGEIEHAVLQVQGIRNACVIYNEAQKDIVLFFEGAPELTAAFIRERMMSFVPKYMLPTVFKMIGALPRNPNGKVDRQRLKESYLSQTNPA